MSSPKFSRSFGRLSAGLIVLVAVAAPLVCVDAAHAIDISYIYGIDNNNNIWELNPVGQTATQVFTAQGKLGISGTANSNAFAYDSSKENMFFMNGSGTTGTLYVWNKPSNSLSIAATAAQLNIASGTLLPGNAAFNAADGKYYFFEDGTADLYRIGFTYAGNIPTFDTRERITVLGDYPSASFGDIAIDPTQGTNGVLFGSTTTGLYFGLDLADPANSYNELGANGLVPQTGLQLSFNFGYSTLYGHQFSTAEWYTVNVGDGTVGASFWTSPVAFRDLGGASQTSSPVPEIDPSAFSGVLAMVLGSLGLLERRRQAAIA